jgi:hypothetical protein
MRTLSRTWLAALSTPGDPKSRHTATLLIDDELVATAEGEDQLAASMNLLDLLRERGIAVDGKVLAVDAFDRLIRAWKRVDRSER